MLNIPPEVFLQICLFAISGKDAISPLLRGKICRSWRRISYEDPYLWARPELTVRRGDTYHQLSVLEEWMERARSLPLTVIVNDPARTLRPMHAMMPLFEIILNKAHQIQSLIVMPRPRFYEDSDNGLQFVAVKKPITWPILSRLHFPSFSDPDLFKLIFTTAPPLLIDLAFDADEFRESVNSLEWITWPNLRHLHIRNLPSDDLLRVLRLAQNLQTPRSDEVRDELIHPYADDVWYPAAYLDLEEEPPAELISRPTRTSSSGPSRRPNRVT